MRVTWLSRWAGDVMADISIWQASIFMALNFNSSDINLVLCL
jgi:hypothetical protein